MDTKPWLSAGKESLSSSEVRLSLPPSSVSDNGGNTIVEPLLKGAPKIKTPSVLRIVLNMLSYINVSLK